MKSGGTERRSGTTEPRHDGTPEERRDVKNGDNGQQMEKEKKSREREKRKMKRRVRRDKIPRRWWG